MKSETQSEVEVVRYPDHRKTEVRSRGDQSPYSVQVEVAPPGPLILAKVWDEDGKNVITLSSTDPSELIKTLLIYGSGEASVETKSAMAPVHTNERGAASVVLAVRDLFESAILMVNGSRTNPHNYE